MSEELLQGSIVFVFAWLAIGGLGVPLPEDAALIAAGILIERGGIHWAAAFTVVMLGVLGGDAVLFLSARRLGPAAYRRKFFQKILPPERRAKIEGAYERYGGRLVFAARHVAGFRAAAFAMAGIAGMKPRRFFFWDGLAALISVPLWMALGYFGSSHVDEMRAHIQYVVLIAVVAAALIFIAWRFVRNRRRAATPDLLARSRPDAASCRLP